MHVDLVARKEWIEREKWKVREIKKKRKMGKEKINPLKLNFFS